MLMRHQFRALIQAAEGQELRLMFPMITEVSEFDDARNLLDLELSRAERRGRPLPKNSLWEQCLKFRLCHFSFLCS